MKKQLNEIKRMQQLAGILKEEQSNSSDPVKDYVLPKFKYEEDDFNEHYGAYGDLDDLMDDGEYHEEAYFNPTPEEEKIIRNLAAKSDKSQNGSYESFIKKYPFTMNPELGIEWTETLHVDSYDEGSDVQIYVQRSIPFNEKVKKWWETL